MTRRAAAVVALLLGLVAFGLNYPTSCSDQDDGSSRAVCSTPIGIEHTAEGPEAEADDAQGRAIAVGAGAGIVTAGAAYVLLRRRRRP